MSDCSGNLFLMNNIEYPVSEFDDAFVQTGNVVYEVVRVEEGIPLFIEDYLDRLQNTIHLSLFAISFDRNQIYKNVSRLISINHLLQGPVKLLLSEHKAVIHFMKPYLPEPQEYLTGVKTILVHEERNNPNAKIWNPPFREKILVALQQNSAYEAILVDRSGNITEGGRSNVFFVKGDCLYTAPASVVLPGITRMKVLEVCALENIKVIEKHISYLDLQSYDAAFLTGTSRKVVPIRLIGEIQLSAENKLVRKIANKFEELVASYIRKHKSARI